MLYGTSVRQGKHRHLCYSKAAMQTSYVINYLKLPALALVTKLNKLNKVIPVAEVYIFI